MKNNKFLRRVKYFIKRNSYALVVSVCVLLALTMIGVATTSLASNIDNSVQENLPTNNPTDIEDEIPTNSNEIITFTLPIKGGKISKEYAENHLLEDKTTGFWQAHMAIDFNAADGTKVLSVYKGVVENIENSLMDGLVITIKHSDSLKSVYKCLADEAFAAG